MSQKRGLTRRQMQYLNWIKKFMEENDNLSPSLEEIGKGMGTSVGAARGVVQALIKRRHLINNPKEQRSLAIPED